MTTEEIIESFLLDLFGGAHYPLGIPGSIDKVVRTFNDVCIKCTREQVLQAIRNTSAMKIVRITDDKRWIFFDEVRDTSNWRDFFKGEFYAKHNKSGRARQKCLRLRRDAEYPRSPGFGFDMIVPRD
jgi:hypothetical protein